MRSLASTPGALSENGSWLGIGLWGLLVYSAGILMLTALSGNTPAPVAAASWEPQARVSPRHGRLQELSSTLPDHPSFTATGAEYEARTGTGLSDLSRHPHRGSSAPSETPRFVLSSSVTMTGDTVAIEVRLSDPETKKVISATTLEGRPDDLSEEIRARFRENPLSAATGEESPAEKAMRAAIVKVASWIGENTRDSVMVKASMTRVKEAPSLQSATLLTVRQGTRLQKIGTAGEWIHIRLESGELGWVYREVLD